MLGKNLPKFERKSLQPYLQQKVFTDQVTAKMDSNTACSLKVSWKCPAIMFIQIKDVFALSNSYKVQEVCRNFQQISVNP